MAVTWSQINQELKRLGLEEIHERYYQVLCSENLL